MSPSCSDDIDLLICWHHPEVRVLWQCTIMKSHLRWKTVNGNAKFENGGGGGGKGERKRREGNGRRGKNPKVDVLRGEEDRMCPPATMMVPGFTANHIWDQGGKKKPNRNQCNCLLHIDIIIPRVPTFRKGFPWGPSYHLLSAIGRWCTRMRGCLPLTPPLNLIAALVGHNCL